MMEELDPDYRMFVKKVKDATAIDLAQYKETQMKRRLTTLRMKNGYDTFNAFFDAMMRDRQLYHEFLDRMTINVSEFWRNSNRWQLLADKFLPDMLKGNRRIKCWSAACSTGEEPYTLAMILAELGALDRSTITATDIDTGALEKAQAGIYNERALREVPKPYVEKYFNVDAAGMTYSVKDNLKKAVRFTKGNLLTDAFEKEYDLIICRNVMIYFTEPAKHALYQKFSDALRMGGVLFVGSTEQIFSPAQYRLATAETFFYRRADV